MITSVQSKSPYHTVISIIWDSGTFRAYTGIARLNIGTLCFVELASCYVSGENSNILWRKEVSNWSTPQFKHKRLELGGEETCLKSVLDNSVLFAIHNQCNSNTWQRMRSVAYHPWCRVPVGVVVSLLRALKATPCSCFVLAGVDGCITI